MNHRWAGMLVVGIGCVALLPAVAAAQMYVYPSQGQSPEQQAADQAQCRSWATQQTGFDPSWGAPPPTASAPAGQGEVVRGAARGAVLGVVGGAIAGDAGKGAAIGAGVGATGGLFNRMGASRAQQQQQEQAQAAYRAQGQEFNRAFAACMVGRGYTELRRNAMRLGLQVAAGTALGLLLSEAPGVAAEDGTPVLCAVSQLFECVDGGACHPISAEAIGAPRFLQVDTASERIHNPEAPERAPGSEVVHSARVDGKLFLQGTDPGIEELRDGVGWTFALAEEERRMVLTAAGDAVAYIGFGACLPAP